MSETTVTAVVVTYNRKHQLVECLTSLLAQRRPPDSIVVVDNASSDGTSAVLQEKGYLGQGDPGVGFHEVSAPTGIPSKVRVHYVRLEENTGGAGGFAEGVRYALELDADWFWLMDDDAVPREDALERLLNHPAADNPDALVLASRKVDDRGRLQVEHCGTFDTRKGHIPLTEEAYERESVPIDYASFVGFMVRRKAVKSVGLPRADFFISYDDVDYSLRIARKGKLFLLPGSVIVHRDFTAERPARSVFGRVVAVESIASYWNYLCHFRNKLYVQRTYGRIGALGSMLILARRLVRIWMLDDHKWLRSKWTLRYFVDSFRSTFTSLTPAQWSQIVEGSKKH